MNIKTILTVAVAISSLSVASAQAKSNKTFTAADQTVSTKLCLTAISGNRPAMHSKMKDYGVSKRYVYNNVQCNEQALPIFVQNHGKNADAMLKMLTPRNTNVEIIDIAKNTLVSK
jgi:hypothetical protein